MCVCVDIYIYIWLGGGVGTEIAFLISRFGVGTGGKFLL